MTQVKKYDMCRPHEYQDRKYGAQMRVMNTLEGKRTGLRCTVCGKEHI